MAEIAVAHKIFIYDACFIIKIDSLSSSPSHHSSYWPADAHGGKAVKSKRWKWSSIDVAGSASSVLLCIYGSSCVLEPRRGSPWLFLRTDVDMIRWTRVHAGCSSAAAGGTFRCVWGQLQLEIEFISVLMLKPKQLYSQRKLQESDDRWVCLQSSAQSPWSTNTLLQFTRLWQQPVSEPTIKWWW